MANLDLGGEGDALEQGNQSLCPRARNSHAFPQSLMHILSTYCIPRPIGIEDLVMSNRAPVLISY